MDHVNLAREIYGAYVSGDRSVPEHLIGDDFLFYSPADVGIGREEYFERCWPNSQLIEDFRFIRLKQDGDEVFVTYEALKRDGKRFRNTEVLTFDGERLTRAEV